MTGQGNELKDTRLHDPATDPVRPAVFAPFVTGDPFIATLGPIARRVSDKTVELRITPAEAALNNGFEYLGRIAWWGAVGLARHGDV